jgi:long-subunit fatty acid transport protein
VQELANPRNGVAQAGQAAYAYDAATALYNPAGMARLEKPAWLVGAQGTWTDVEFDLGSQTTFKGGDGGQQGGFIPGAALYYARPLNQRWSVGASLAGFAGGALDPSNDWAGRYYVTKLNLAALGLNPVVSYRVNDWLSVGGGVSLNYGTLDFDLRLPRLSNLIDGNALANRFGDLPAAARAAIAERLDQAKDEIAAGIPPRLPEIIAKLPPPVRERLRDRAEAELRRALGEMKQEAQMALEPKLARIARASDFLEPGPDGEVEMSDVDDFAVNFNAGILLELSDRTRFGINYRSKVDFEMSGDFDVKDIPPLFQALGLTDGDVDADVPIPQLVRASVYHELTDTLAIMGDVGWEDWSEMDFLPISGPAGRTLEAPVQWHDTWHFGIGAEWRAAPAWLLQAGVAYDTSPVRDRQHNQAYMPSDRQWRFSTGVVHDWNERVQIGLNYTLIDFGRSPMDLSNAFGRFQGDFDDFRAHVVALSVSF